MSVSLVVRTSKKLARSSNEEVRISIRVRRSNFDAICSTEASVPNSCWSASKGDIKKSADTDKELMDRLNRTAEYLRKLKEFIELQDAKGAITSSEVLKNYVKAYRDKYHKPTNAVPQEPIALLKYKIAQMVEGTNRNSGRRFSVGTIKQWKNLLRLLTKFHNHCRAIDFEEIDAAFWDVFKNFCDDEGLMPSSVNKYLATFRAFIIYAKTNGVEVNEAALLTYKKIAVKSDDRKAKTYLNEEELQALYNMPLTGLREKVRDVFLLGSYLGQRVSDYNNLTRGDFRLSSSGRFRVVAFTQEKTENAVVVPIIFDEVYAIAEKYNYDFPRISDVIINRYIKDIAKELSDSVPSLAEKMRTTLDSKEQRLEEAGKVVFERDAKGYVVKPRYEMITTHTARRSCITNLYLRNIFTTAQLMSISGHKSEKAFNEYICCSSDEIADRIAEIAENAKKHHSDMF